MDEQIFHQTLKKIRWSTNRDDLASATRTTLQLLLRRPVDQNLLNALLAQLDRIIRGLAAGKGEQQSAEIRQAAIRCVVLLQSAKGGRLSRAQQDDQRQRARHRRVLILVAATAATAAFYLFLMPQRNIGQPNETKFGALCRQMGDATLTIIVNQYQKK